jgi:hypothetical protein
MRRTNRAEQGNDRFEEPPGKAAAGRIARPTASTDYANLI